MKLTKQLLIVSALFAMVFTGCKKQNPSNSNKATASGKQKANSIPTSRPSKRGAAVPTKARRPTSWINKRIKDAEERLGKSEGGKLVAKAIKASGGLSRWFSNGPLQFRFAYRPLSGKKVKDTNQVVDTWSSRAVHTQFANPKWSFGWDGKVAWRKPKGVNQKTPIRFWALTPFYFVGVPFVFADPGLILKKEGTIKFEGQTYHQVRVTFGAGVGDAPKDFYVVYIHTKTHRVGGVRYIVSYPGFFPKGGHSPEKFMSYDGTQIVDGISFPKTFRTFKWKGKKTGKLVTRTTMSKVSFRPDLLDSFFHVPNDAEVLKGLK